MKLEFGDFKKNIILWINKQDEKNICSKIQFNQKFSFGTDKNSKINTEFYYKVLKPELYANSHKILIKIEHEKPIDYQKLSNIVLRKELACKALSISEETIDKNAEKVVSYMKALEPIDKIIYDLL